MNHGWSGSWGNKGLTKLVEDQKRYGHKSLTWYLNVVIYFTLLSFVNCVHQNLYTKFFVIYVTWNVFVHTCMPKKWHHWNKCIYLSKLLKNCSYGFMLWVLKLIFDTLISRIWANTVWPFCSARDPILWIWQSGTVWHQVKPLPIQISGHMTSHSLTYFF